MLKQRLAAVLLVGAVALTACSENLAPGSANENEEERAEVIQVAEASGFFADAFGVDGVFDDVGTISSASLVAGAPAAIEVEPPRRWGRRFGLPVRRILTVDVNHEEGTALVTKELVFEGQFLQDHLEDDIEEPSAKPLEVTLIIQGLFRRIERDVAANNDGASDQRRWELVGVTPAELMMTAEDKRTVSITKVQVWAGEEMLLEITDPTELLRLGDESLPRLDREVEVVVKAWVTNRLENDLQPSTFGFLHVRHANRDAIEWGRRVMTLMEDDEGGVYYQAGWYARRLGRARIGIDMIDAQTFQNLTEDDYRGNAWGIPYRIVGPNGEETEDGSDTGGDGQ